MDKSNNLLNHEILKTGVLEEAIKLYKETGEEHYRDFIITHNYRYAYKMAKKHASRAIHLDDLLQECLLGLCDAIDSFDFRRNTTFSTYAHIHMSKRIFRYIQQTAHIISLPAYITDFMRKVKAEHPGETITMEKILQKYDVSEMTAFYVNEYIHQTFISMNKPMSRDSDEELSGFLIAPQDENFREYIHEYEMLYLKVRMALNNRQREVIINRFGLYDNPQLTLEEIGRKLSITRERIRQIEDKSILSLRKAYGVKDNDIVPNKIEQDHELFETLFLKSFSSIQSLSRKVNKEEMMRKIEKQLLTKGIKEPLVLRIGLSNRGDLRIRLEKGNKRINVLRKLKIQKTPAILELGRNVIEDWRNGEHYFEIPKEISHKEDEIKKIIYNLKDNEKVIYKYSDLI